MEIITSVKPLLVVSVSLLGVLLIAASARKPNLRESWTILAALTKFSLVVSMLPSILKGNVIEYFLISVLPGLDIKFRVDAFGLFFALTSSFLWIINSFYSIGYMRALKEHAQTRFYICFAIALSATMGIAFSANIFTLFIFYEILTICTYPLVIHKETPEAIRGGKRYLTYLLGTSIGFQLFAIFLTYNIAGTLEFSNHGILAGKGSAFLLTIIFILFIAGIGKGALMPFHSWLPAAMVAPTPVSALLHAVAVVKAGVFTIIKIILFVFGIDLASKLGLGHGLAYFASFTIIVSSIVALRQDNLKLRLAYSTISQLSYIILGVALLSPDGITGGIMHIIIHAFGKITLFFTAGAIYVATHKTNISELDGIGKQMPFTMTAFTIASLSMIGIPPAAGFISKWYLVLGSIEANQIPIIIVIAASTILNACYFLPIVYAAFFKELPPGEKRERKEAPAFMVVSLMLTAIGTLLLFFYSSALLDIVSIVTAGVTGGN
ncbi:MAG: monovalent cation/H+ antiporter subunit D family protein [Nitrospinota bacterium]